MRRLSLTTKMHGLFHRHDGDRGAIAAIVAVVVGGLVLTGVAALTIDAGALYVERRTVQNAADAGALALAQACAKGDIGRCSSTSFDLTDLANKNSRDDAMTDVASVCGTVAARFASCAPPPAPLRLPDCTKLPSSLAGAKWVDWVEVHAKTRSSNSKPSLLRPFFARLGDSTYEGTGVKACARAAWGPAGPPPGPVFPVTFSYCDWKAQTGANPAATPPVPGNYVPPPAKGMNPGYGAAPNTPWPAAGSEVTLYTKGSSGPCPSWNGHVAPGSFGTLDNTNCDATVVDGWVGGEPGNSIPCPENVLKTFKGQIVYIPIFDCFTKTKLSFANCSDGKNHDWFHISGYAAFYLTGYYFSGSKDGESIFPPDGNAKPCNGGDRCVSGWFTTDTLQTTIDTSGAPGFGTTAVQVTG